MKLLLLHDVQADKQNGVSVSLGILYRELIKTDNEIKILTLSDCTKSYKDGNNYFLSSVPMPIYPGIRMRPPIANKLIDELVEWNPDIIHTNCEFSTFLIARHIKAHCKIAPKWVHTFHTDYKYYIGMLQNIKTIRDKAIPKLLNKCFKMADTVIVPTVKMYNYVVNDSMFSKNIKIKIIPTGIDFSEIESNPDDSVSKTRKEIGVPEDAKVILFLGRVSSEKNLDELLEYFKRYIAENEDIYFLSVGDGPYKKTLIKKAQDPAFSNKVIVHDSVPHNTIRKYYDAADVFASASVSETQGLTFYEALYCGVPVLAKDKECLQDAIIEGVNGAFFHDYESFAVALDSIIDLKANAEDGTLPKLPECYESEIFARSVMETYKELLADEAEEAPNVPKNSTKCNVSFTGFKKKINIKFEFGGRKKNK